MSPLRVLGLAMVAVVAAAALADPENGRDPVLVCAVVAFAVAAGIFLARELPLAVGLGSLVVAGLAVLLLYGRDPAQVPLGLFLLGAMAPLQRPPGAGLAVVGATSLGYVAVEIAQGRAGGTLAATMAGVAFFVVVGRLVLRERAQRERIADLMAELERSREAERAATAQAERTRLARDLHDILAHTLSGLAIQLEAARLLASADGTATQLRQAVEAAHRLSRTGLDEARRAVAMLRGNELPGPEGLRQLADEHRLATGCPVQVEITGEPFPLLPEQRIALHRTAQEALTNVRKHAPGAAVELRLDWGTDEAVLIVADDGGGSGSGVARPTDSIPGYGLAGMAERAQLAGGTLETGPSASGFRVRLILPSADPRTDAERRRQDRRSAS